jgi:hypothetical protein
MLQALIRTFTEVLDSKKATYSLLATVLAIALHLKFAVPIESALLLVSPLGLATAAQAHVDAKRVASSTKKTSESAASVNLPSDMDS